MPAKTEKQKRFFGAVMGAKKGQKNVSGKAKKVSKQMPKKKIKDFLKTKDKDKKSCWKGYKKMGTKKKGNRRVNKCVKESTDNLDKPIVESESLSKFVDCIFTKNYASAGKYLKSVVEDKIMKKIEKELNTPLF